METLEDLKEFRESCMDSIEKRHEVAFEEMRKSLENISDDTPIAKTKNTDTLNEILNALDKLLED